MLKEIFRFLSRQTAQPVTAQALSPMSNLDNDELRIQEAILHLKKPQNTKVEHTMSDQAVERLGSDAFLLLPKISEALEASDWSVMWQVDKVRFVFKNRAWLRFSELTELARMAVEEAARDPAAEGFSAVHLSAICSEIASLNRQSSELAGEDYEAQKPGFLESLRKILGVDWHVEPYFARHDFVVCSPSRECNDLESETFQSGKPTAVHTIH
ncbi:hypothetical protein G6L68_25210 [Agrobacterium fabrum]|uniref:hypothetical protein n=1 Tax=Agrobacterium fabrum TaxID=1176649 RepID=UPI000EF59AA8|nr:hypothetical protein [Agrobacterium fabrum]AYM66186.1 hypothetical protein At12D13_50340 [Agrobacterium fabrum]NTE63933.1 hypothetical protein [Agrobacterium fabrum]